MKTVMKSRVMTWAAALAIGITFAAVMPESNASATVITPDTIAKQAAKLVKYIVASDGNEARYRVREQLAGRDLENDAIGSTTEVTGAIFVDEAGKVIRDSSKFTIDLGSLKSDSDRRDGYVRRNTLQVSEYPTATFVPFELRGLPARGLPSTGPFRFQVIGELTIHGVSRVTAWDVNAQAVSGAYTGLATTRFQFADYKMTQPRVPIVLGVKDTIQLEYQFKLVPASN